MLDLSFFTTLQIGWFNAWIPAFGMVLIQFVYMALFPETGKRAVDTSWYTSSDRLWASVSSCLQIALLVLSVFVPFKFGMVRHGRRHICSFAGRLYLGISQLRHRPSWKNHQKRYLSLVAQPHVLFLFHVNAGHKHCLRLALAAPRHCSLWHCDALHHPWRRALLRTDIRKRISRI